MLGVVIPFQRRLLLVWTILASVEIGRGGVNTRRNRESKAIELLGELETFKMLHGAQQLVITVLVRVEDFHTIQDPLGLTWDLALVTWPHSDSSDPHVVAK